MKKMIKQPVSNKRAQQGWTFWSLLFTLSVVLFFAYIGMRLVPVYSDDQAIKKAMSMSMKEISQGNVSRGQIASKMSRQMQLDGTTDAVNLKKDLTVKRKGDKIIANVKYEREIPLFLNISLLLKFDNKEEK